MLAFPFYQNAASDLNSNGAVDGVDYNIWLRNFQGPHGGDLIRNP